MVAFNSICKHCFFSLHILYMLKRHAGLFINDTQCTFFFTCDACIFYIDLGQEHLVPLNPIGFYPYSHSQKEVTALKLAHANINASQKV